jgi:hypothetical protein
MAETLLVESRASREMVDRLAALGMVSVFDIEEVGGRRGEPRQWRRSRDRATGPRRGRGL